MMILHHGWRSSASRRVRLCLAEKGLTYEGHKVDMARIADIAAAPFVKRIDEEIAPDEVTEKKHPRVAGWWTRLQGRPAYAQANFGPFVDS